MNKDKLRTISLVLFKARKEGMLSTLNKDEILSHWDDKEALCKRLFDIIKSEAEQTIEFLNGIINDTKRN